MTYEKTIILLSGPIGSGKTTLAMHMKKNYSAYHVSTAALLSALTGRNLDRKELQRAGLERQFQRGEWMADEVTRLTRDHPTAGVIVVDAVRTVEQVREIRDLALGKWRVLHVHLMANDQHLAELYNSRARSSDSGVGWSVAKESLTETAMIALESGADLAIDTSRITSDDVAVRVGSRLRPGRPQYAPCVDA